MLDGPWNFKNALCLEVGVEGFFETSYKIQPKESVKKENNLALKICSNCEHQYSCAEWAIKHELYGIWGGTTPQQRKEIRKKRNIIIDGELDNLE